MDGVTILWAAVGGTALTLAGVHGFLWLLDRRGIANLAFCIVAISVAGLSVTEVGMMHSVSAEQYGYWVRWFHLPNSLAIVGLVVFVHLQFGTGRTWLAAMIIALRMFLLVENFLVEPNVTWREISSIRSIPFLGEEVAVVGGGVLRSTQSIATFASLLFIVYVTDALVAAWSKGNRETRRKAAVICGGVLAFITLAIVESQLVVWNLVHLPVVVAPPFVILVAAVTYELSRDIITSAAAEREVQRLREDLAHVARINMVSQLSGSLAHELRQPLTAMQANAQAAQRMLGTASVDLGELDAILTDIRKDNARADAIIVRTRTLLTRSRLEVDDVSVAAIARDVLALVRTDAIKRGVSVEASIPDSIPPLRADRVQLLQLLLNLVINAMDAVSAKEARERRVRIEARRASDDRVEIAVVDWGTGVAVEVLPRVFDAFVTTKPTGLGIGLAVSRAIVEGHGGQISVENNPGGGATFRFTLAAAAA